MQETRARMPRKTDMNRTNAECTTIDEMPGNLRIVVPLRLEQNSTVTSDEYATLICILEFQNIATL